MNVFETEEFLEKIKDQNAEAISEYVRHFTGHLYKQCIRFGYNKEEAEDIVQNTWITFFEVVKKFERKSTLKTFLYGVFYNKSMEFKRKNIRLKDNINFEDHFDNLFDSRGHMIKEPINPEKFSLGKQMQEIIASCLDLLPIKQKIAFTLKEVEDEESAEICKTLNITTSNLGVLLFRARNQLRECVEGKVN